MQLRAKGPLVADLQRGFLQSWFFTTNMLHGGERYLPREIKPVGSSTAQISVSSPVSHFPTIMYSVAWMAQNARRYLYLQTPYFMPPTPVLSALQSAALAGIDVRLMLPEKTDTFWLKWANESYFTDMLSAGVKVYLYRKGFLHTKALVMDDTCCQIGTANLDFRSFENNFEQISCIVRDVFLMDMQECIRLERDAWDNRPLAHRWINSHVRILSPLL
jgi:cardiolipin synthase